MLIMLDTSTNVCKLTFLNGEWRQDFEWQADRMMAKGLLGFISNSLSECDKDWSDIFAIGGFEGPGSFTGLRIGLTVLNTMADSLDIPIVSAKGDNWQNTVLEKINSSKNEKIILPFYGSDAKITPPKK